MITVLADRNIEGQSLVFLTIGRINRLDEKGYRERCALRLVEILADLDDFMGSGRIFIP